jgi:hypothetical protein
VQNIVGKPQWTRPRCRWLNNIKIYLREIRYERTTWIKQVQNKVQWWPFVNTVTRKYLGNFLTSWVIISFSSITLHHGILFDGAEENHAKPSVDRPQSNVDLKGTV